MTNIKKSKIAKMVNETLKQNKNKQIINCLQDINKELLNSKIIFGNDCIYPLWVEAYYYNKNMHFMDESCHDTENRFYKQFNFRIHEKKGKHAGVDLYLGKTNANYYLSFLIKYAFVISENGSINFYTQSKLAEFISKKGSQYKKEVEIISDKHINNAVNFENKNFYKLCDVKRVNITKGDYKNSKLASYWKLLNNKRKRKKIDSNNIYRSLKSKYYTDKMISVFN